MGDFLAELFSELLSLIILTPLGFVYLHLRYPDNKQLEHMMRNKYENSYANAGQDVVLSLVAIVGILLVMGLLLSPLLHWLRELRH